MNEQVERVKSAAKRCGQRCKHCEKCGQFWMNDIQTSHCPSDMSRHEWITPCLSLLTSYEELESKLSATERELRNANRGAQTNAKINESLARKLSMAVEGLRHYADEGQWMSDKAWSRVYFGSGDTNGYDKARTVLTDIEETAAESMLSVQVP